MSDSAAAEPIKVVNAVKSIKLLPELKENPPAWDVELVEVIERTRSKYGVCAVFHIKSSSYTHMYKLPTQGLL